MTLLADAECIHGLEPAWCTPCKVKFGYRPGTTRQLNDCTVVTLVDLLDVTYGEAERLLAEAGKRTGKGSDTDQLRSAVEAAGHRLVPVLVNPLEALRRSNAQGGRYLVAAWVRGKGHAFPIIDGAAHNPKGFLTARRSQVWKLQD